MKTIAWQYINKRYEEYDIRIIIIGCHQMFIKRIQIKKEMSNMLTVLPILELIKALRA